jgi:hypothetical protein
MTGQDLLEYRELTTQVISSEKRGFWSDWTQEQQELYASGDWEAFSRSRGYTEEQIADFKEWIEMSKIYGLEVISDLTSAAAVKNLKEDKNEEIALSSRIPGFRSKITSLETKIRERPEAIIGDAFPLRHTFADGMYVREISVPKGYLVVTKIHKLSHPCFVLKGDCTVLTEDGPKRIKAPYHMITPAGTKRIVYVHEDTVWVTVHKTNETELDKIEEEIILPKFEDAVEIKAEEVKLMEFVEEAKKGDTL